MITMITFFFCPVSLPIHPYILIAVFAIMSVFCIVSYLKLKKSRSKPPFKTESKFCHEMKAVFDTTKTGFAIYNADGILEEINKACMEIYGIRDRDLTKAKKIHITDNPNYASLMESTEEGKRTGVVCFDFDALKKHDPSMTTVSGKKWLDVTLDSVYDDNGELECTVVTTTDVSERINHIKTIDEMNRKMTSLMELGGMSSWVFDVKNNRRHSMQGQSILSFEASDEDYDHNLHPEDAAMIKESFEKMKRGEMDELHTVVRFRSDKVDGGYSYFDIHTVARREQGKLVDIACVNMDITTQMLYQQQLEQNETRTMLVFRGGEMTQYDFNVISDKYTIFRGGDIFSNDMVEISMDQHLSMMHPEDTEKYADIVRKMRAGEDFSYSVDYRIKTEASSEWQDILVTNVPLEKDSKGKVIRYTGLRRNNTKWRKLSTELEKNNLLLKTVMNQMPCMLFIKDVEDDYRYVVANDLFCENLGSPPEDVLGHTDYDIKETKEEADRFRGDDVEAVEMGIKSFKEQTMWCGKRTVWHTTKSCINTNTGQRLMVGISTDITSLEDAFDELDEAKKKAERSDLLKSTFLANMSHEIRTPLNAIVGFSDLLLTTESREEKDVFGKIITDNSELLLNLVNDILDMSKIEAGYLDFNIEPVDLSKMFVQFYNVFFVRMQPGVVLSCFNPYQSCVMDVDKNRLAQVVNNYMSNAIKYTPSGKIEFGYEYVDEGVRIFVKDTGIGIDEEYRPRVFCRFEKFDSLAQGTGLGLSICKVIIEALGGNVGYDSTKGVGSEFWAWIPGKAIINGKNGNIELKVKNGEKADGDNNSGKEKILVVEDNDSNFVLLNAILKNYEVVRATNGLDAVNLAKDKDFSIIFMDLKMPIMGGLEATRLIRAFDSETPIIALTANAFDSDRDEALKAGCTKYVAKPLRKADIMKLLK